MSGLPISVKKKLTEMLAKAKQEAMQVQAPAMQLEMEKGKADTDETRSRTMLNMAKVRSEGAPEGGPDMIETMQAAAGFDETQARTAKTMAETQKIQMETNLLPLQRLSPSETKANVSV